MAGASNKCTAATRRRETSVTVDAHAQRAQQHAEKTFSRAAIQQAAAAARGRRGEEETFLGSASPEAPLAYEPPGVCLCVRVCVFVCVCVCVCTYSLAYEPPHTHTHTHTHGHTGSDEEAEAHDMARKMLQATPAPTPAPIRTGSIGHWTSGETCREHKHCKQGYIIDPFSGVRQWH